MTTLDKLNVQMRFDKKLDTLSAQQAVVQTITTTTNVNNTITFGNPVYADKPADNAVQLAVGASNPYTVTVNSRSAAIQTPVVSINNASLPASPNPPFARIDVTCSQCFSNSLVFVQVIAYTGTYVTDGTPMAVVDNVANGSFSIFIMDANWGMISGIANQQITVAYEIVTPS